MKYRKKPVVIDAFRWDGADIGGLTRWAAEVDIAHRKARGEWKGRPADVSRIRADLRGAFAGPGPTEITS